MTHRSIEKHDGGIEHVLHGVVVQILGDKHRHKVQNDAAMSRIG
jgi:hypothetical protein